MRSHDVRVLPSDWPSAKPTGTAEWFAKRMVFPESPDNAQTEEHQYPDGL